MRARPVRAEGFGRLLLVYRLLAPFLFLALLPGALLRAYRRGGGGGRWAERLGRFDLGTDETLAGCVWVRSISVGETFVAVRFVAALRQAGWKGPVVLTATTATGIAVAEPHAEALSMRILFNPLDFSGTVDRFLEVVRPRTICFVEGDFWPNLMDAARIRQIPTHVVNARLSPRSAARYACVREWLSPLFATFESVQVADEASGVLWERISSRRARVMVSGNLKFDGGAVAGSELDEKEVKAAGVEAWTKGTVLVAGSTHDGEELWIAEVWRSVCAAVPDVRLVVVPRHVERSGEVVRSLAEAGFSVRRFSESAGESGSDSAVLVVDCTGVLRGWYGVASVAFVGRSVLAQGGQNPAEPVVAGAATVVGPHMQNFDGITRELVKAGGMIQLRVGEDAVGVIRDLLCDSGRRARMAEAGRAVLSRHDGASLRAARWVLEGLV
jgi:3-deoxy-D-manno-octulosonic-acid transferase